MTPSGAPFIDTGNQLLSQVPVRMETGTVDTPAGKVAVLTLRSATTTMTALLGVADLRAWTEVLGDLADSIDGGGEKKVVPASAFDVAALAARGALSHVTRRNSR